MYHEHTKHIELDCHFHQGKGEKGHHQNRACYLSESIDEFVNQSSSPMTAEIVTQQDGDYQYL